MSEESSGRQRPVDALQGLPGVPESRLEPAVVSRLPSATPLPPWDTTADAVLWAHQAAAAAGTVLPQGVRGRRVLGFAIAGFLRYHHTPVGAYNELLASPTLVRGGLWRLHVPVIAVDSPASVHAGRTHWALPKMLAEFSGAPAASRSVEARGSGWSLNATVAARGPTVPAWMRVSLAQVRSTGEVVTFSATFRGPVRLARVEVTMSESASFADWLLPGSHLGLLLRDVRIRLRPVR